MLRHEPLDERSMQEILSRAAEIDGKQSIDLDLLERTATELGISVEAVRQAEAEHRKLSGERRLREQFISKRRDEFRQHLIPYVVVNVFLHCINFFTSMGDRSPEYWAVFPLLGWGIGLAIHFMTTRATSGHEFEEEFAKWKAKKIQRAIQAKAELGDIELPEAHV